MTEQERDYDDLPDELVARLKAADRARPIVDPRTDRAVLDAARKYFAVRRDSYALTRTKRLIPAAVAAAVVLALLILQPVDRLRHPDDIDRSGSVDILDAFALARMPGEEERSAALATRVVSLSPRRAP